MDPMIRISRARKNIGPVVMALLVIHLFSEARPETEETKKRFAGSGSSFGSRDEHDKNATKIYHNQYISDRYVFTPPRKPD